MLYNKEVIIALFIYFIDDRYRDCSCLFNKEHILPFADVCRAYPILYNVVCSDADSKVPRCLFDIGHFTSEDFGCCR